MSNSQPVGCSRPVGQSTTEEHPQTPAETSAQQEKGAPVMIKAGQKAPEFSAGAYFNGEFTSVNLSDYLGKWVVLCFYPGDFTFV